MNKRSTGIFDIDGREMFEGDKLNCPEREKFIVIIKIRHSDCLWNPMFQEVTPTIYIYKSDYWKDYMENCLIVIEQNQTE